MPQEHPTPRHSVSVAGAISDADGRFLAIRRRDNSHWELPGGVLELDETPEEGVVREVLEETGVVVEPEHVTGIYKNMSRGIIALVFRCRHLAGEAKPTPEASQVAWLTPEEITSRMDEAYSVRLLDALTPGPVIVRAHDGVRILA